VQSRGRASTLDKWRSACLRKIESRFSMKSSLAVCLALTVSAYAQDSGSALARILAAKGTITASELAQVESVAPSDRVNVLADLLRQKGVLDASEVARVKTP